MCRHSDELADIAYQLATQGLYIDTLWGDEVTWRCSWCRARVWGCYDPSTQKPTAVLNDRRPAHDEDCPVGRARDLLDHALTISRQYAEAAR